MQAEIVYILTLAALTSRRGKGYTEKRLPQPPSEVVAPANTPEYSALAAAFGLTITRFDQRLDLEHAGSVIQLSTEVKTDAVLLCPAKAQRVLEGSRLKIACPLLYVQRHEGMFRGILLELP